MGIYENIIAVLKEKNIPYQEWEHAPILSYEDAEREQKNCGWEGIESKNVCLSGSDNSCCIYVTTAGKRVDMKKLKELTGQKYRLADETELKKHIGCVPGCVSPFGFTKDILMVIEEDIFNIGEYLFSPGLTTKTIQINAKFLKDIFQDMPNRKIYI
jgi:Ala-tRNA(Pro) deacylase